LIIPASATDISMEKSPHFKPDLCALLLIDHQVGTIQLIKNITADQSIRNAVTLAKAALAFDMPIVMTSSQEGHVQGPLHPSLERTAPDAFVRRVQRQGVVNAWDDPNFAQAVANAGRKQLIVAAVTTDICLVFPTISTVEAGYEVQAVLDASGSSFAIGAHTLAGCGHFMTEERPQFVIDQILKLSARVAGRSEPQEIAL
jgi:nicotinamidase-related amidase